MWDEIELYQCRPIFQTKYNSDQNSDVAWAHGGYILAGGVGLPERSKHENVMAVTKALEKYGYYRK